MSNNIIGLDSINPDEKGEDRKEIFSDYDETKAKESLSRVEEIFHEIMEGPRPSFLQDVIARPGRYAKDLWQCSAVSFSTGNAFYAGVTGLVGGFTLGALPAAAIQLGVTAWLGLQQARATYRGEGYHTPFKSLAIANWATAAVLMCGAFLTAGTPLAIATAALPALVLAEWGRGHWDLGCMIGRIEAHRKAGQAQELTDEQIAQTIGKDRRIARLTKGFQTHYGAADAGAVVTAAVKGETVQAILWGTLHGLTHWGSALPLASFGLGLAKAFFPQKAGAFVDKVTPAPLKRLLRTSTGDVTPNRYYGLGYVIAGLGALTMTITAAPTSGAGLALKAAGLATAYTSWARGYFALDEIRPAPESAAQHRARRDALRQNPAHARKKEVRLG